MENNEPAALEIERKFLIEMPDLEELIGLHKATVTSILQTYLISDNDIEGKRVRQRGRSGDFIFYETKKKSLSNLVRIEEERQVSANEYLELLMSADTTLHQIRKDRYCFNYKDICFELDVYPFWTDKAIMEVELESEMQKVELPDFISIIKEVTEDPTYKNRSMAREIPIE
jgi:CYTH domain-containing protein